MSERSKEEKPTYNEKKNENACHNDHKKKTKSKTKTVVQQCWF